MNNDAGYHESSEDDVPAADGGVELAEEALDPVGALSYDDDVEPEMPVDDDEPRT